MRFEFSARALFQLALLCLLAACGGGDDVTRVQTLAEPAQTPGKARTAATGAQATVPVAAFTGNGWYWNPAEGGTGFMFEAQGNRAFVGFFMYEEGSGKPIWYAATGDLVNGDAAGDHRFAGDLRVYHGGMGLTDRTRTSPTSRSLGAVGIDFAGGRAIVSLPGGRVMNAERFCAGGPCVANPAEPNIETGWYWNPDEGGRGYAIETYDRRSFMGIFHYDPDGSPVWHVSSIGGPNALERVTGDLDAGFGVSAGLELYTGGQSLTSSYRKPTGTFVARVNRVVSSSCAGNLEIAGLPQIALRRFVIDGSPVLPGFECKALAGPVDVPDIPGGAGYFSHAGDLIYGLIDNSGDADAYSIYLYPGTYTFDLLGEASGSGTLPDPSLSLYDSNGAQIADNDDRDPTSSESRIAYTVTSEGVYQLRVRSSSKNAGSGSFLLKISGNRRNSEPEVFLPASGYEGVFTGKLLGPDLAYLSLEVRRDGSVGGALRFKDAAMVYVSGSVAAGGTLAFSGLRSLDSFVQCKANLVLGRSPYTASTTYLYTALFGGCGKLGMLVGSFEVRQPSTPIEVPLVARVGDAVRMSSANTTGRHEWYFGDGSTGYGASTQHVYVAPGSYTVVHGAGDPALTDAVATLTVVCADGTICTDFEEPSPWVAIDSVACELRDIPPSAGRPYAQGPVITFAGRASVPSNYQIRAIASRIHPKTEDEFITAYQGSFLQFTMVSLDTSCPGRSPCSSGPITVFSDNPLTRGDGLLHTLPQPLPPLWLYVAVFDRTTSRLYSLAEKSVTCPAFVPLPTPTPPRDEGTDVINTRHPRPAAAEPAARNAGS